MTATPNPDEPLRTAELRRASRLTLPDCCLLGLALARRADLGTFDSGLADVARGRGLPVRP